MMSGPADTPGRRLKPEYVRSGRPERIHKVLIVDDNVGILKAAARILGSLGWEITAVDPERPIEDQVFLLAAQHHFDLVIMDGNMPGIKGSELTALLRAGKFSGYILANSSDELEQKNMLRDGADFTLPDKQFYQLKNFFDA